MENKKEMELLLAHSCCTLSNNNNLLCHICPWHNKAECKDTRFADEVIMDAVAKMRGNKTMKRMELDKIHIPQAFAETTPNTDKVEKYREYYRRNGVQAKPIVTNRKNMLIDGYIQYLILKENNEETGVVIQKSKLFSKKLHKEYYTEPTYRNTRTTYIYGVHTKGNSSKERVWRVSASWENWADDIKTGDLILCETSNGNRQVRVTKIETLDKCPVDIPVKKVCRRNYISEGKLCYKE